VCQAQEKKAIEVSRIRLYLPDAPLRQRIGKDVTPLADYVKSLEKEITSFWEETEQPKAKGLLVAVGIKPGKKSRLWCDAIEGEIPAEMLSKLEKKLAEVPTIAVKEAPIAFALEVRLWGQKPDKFPEIPKAWVDAAKKSKVPLMIPDELFKVVWPE
jgi:hypothetical protein